MRVLKRRMEEHFTFEAVEDDRSLALVGKGRDAYLWVGASENGATQPFVFNGPQALRALARAILRNVPERKRPTPRKER